MDSLGQLNSLLLFFLEKANVLYMYEPIDLLLCREDQVFVDIVWGCDEFISSIPSFGAETCDDIIKNELIPIIISMSHYVQYMCTLNCVLLETKSSFIRSPSKW